MFLAQSYSFPDARIDPRFAATNGTVIVRVRLLFLFFLRAHSPSPFRAALFNAKHFQQTQRPRQIAWIKQYDPSSDRCQSSQIFETWISQNHFLCYSLHAMASAAKEAWQTVISIIFLTAPPSCRTGKTQRPKIKSCACPCFSFGIRCARTVLLPANNFEAAVGGNLP